MKWSTHAYVEGDQRKPQDRVMLKMFIRFYAMLGVRLVCHERLEKKLTDEDPVKRRSLPPYLTVVRCLIVVAYVVFVTGTTYTITRTLQNRPSLLDLVRFVYHLSSFVIILYGGVIMCWYASTLSQIIFASEGCKVRFYPRHFVVPLLMCLPSFLHDVYTAVRSFLDDRLLIQSMSCLCGMYVWVIHYATIGMYTQCEAAILGQLREISQTAVSLPPNEDSLEYLTRAKSSARLSIEKINSIFGSIMLLFYLKIFMLVTLRFGSIVIWGGRDNMAASTSIMSLVSAALQIVQVFETTRLGSLIITESQRAENALYAPRKRNWAATEKTQRYLMEMRRVLRFREHIDTLTISDCFINCKAVMFTYLGTMFTCIAIVLQFDFNVLRALDRAKQTTAVP